MNHKELYSNLTIQLRARLPRASVAQVRNQALMSLALAHGPNCHLATLANQLPIPGQRENLVQRIRRWLDSLTMSYFRTAELRSQTRLARASSIDQVLNHQGNSVLG